MDPACKNTVVYRVIDEVLRSASSKCGPDRPISVVVYEQLHAQGLLRDRPKDDVLKVMRDALPLSQERSPYMGERIYDALAANQMLR
jgi:hypothetical protein